jgi:F-type H+-transporting ATPase subunit delta
MSPEDRVQAYVAAFYEAAMERWLASLETAAQHLEADPELRARAEAPELGFPRQQDLLDGLLPADADQTVRNLLYTLAQRGDLAALPEIVTGLRERVRRGAEGPAVVEVVSAIPLTDPECAALQQKLEASFGQGIDIRYRVDPAILGGIIVRAGDKLIDGSVASRLAGLRQSLGLPAAEPRKT